MPIRNTRRIERAADDVIPNTREILHPPATNQYDRVLLQIVSNTGDVCVHLATVGKPNTGNLAQRRVGLLGGLGEYAKAHTTALRCAHQVGRIRSRLLAFAPVASELLDGRRLSRMPSDPETGLAYEYEQLDPTSYQLCATFDRPSASQLAVDFWIHDAGRGCFSFTHSDLEND